MFGPRELAAVDDRPPEGCPVPTDELGQRVHDDVCAVTDRLHHERGRDGVVSDERDAATVGNLGDGLDVDDVAGGVADRLAEDAARRLVDQPGDRIGAIVLREADLDAEGRQHVCEVGEGCPVELRRYDEICAGAGDRQHRVADGGHP